MDIDTEIKKLRSLLSTDDLLLSQAITMINYNQTSDERNSKSTNHDNGIGWTVGDAHWMGSMADFIKAHGPIRGGQIPPSRKKIMKYARQLIKSGFKYDASNVVINEQQMEDIKDDIAEELELEPEDELEDEELVENEGDDDEEIAQLKLQIEQLQEQIVQAYQQGLAKGIRAYAYWHNGSQFVGSNATPLEEALKDASSGRYP